MGAVGLDWRIEGFGDFSGRPGETDMLIRNVNSGELLLYDIAPNNQITGANFLGPFGLDWQFRRRRSDPSSRHLRSRVAQRQQRLIPGLQYRRPSRLDWQLGGFAPAGSTGSPAAAGVSGPASRAVAPTEASASGENDDIAYLEPVDLPLPELPNALLAAGLTACLDLANVLG